LSVRPPDFLSIGFITFILKNNTLDKLALRLLNVPEGHPDRASRQSIPTERQTDWVTHNIQRIIISTWQSF
jgi:hypothetical protein